MSTTHSISSGGFRKFARLLLSSLIVPVTFAAFSILTSSQASAQATTVQLPTFRNFVYRGAVKVPDGGTTMLGGINRSASGANSLGAPIAGNLPGAGRAFRNRSIGRESETARSSVKVEIINQEELEAKMLGDAARNGQINIDADAESIAQKAAFLSKHVGRRSDLEKSFNDR